MLLKEGSKGVTVSYSQQRNYGPAHWSHIDIASLKNICKGTPANYNSIYTYTFFYLTLSDDSAALEELKQTFDLLPSKMHRHCLTTFKQCLSVAQSSNTETALQYFKSRKDKAKAHLQKFVFGGLMNINRRCTHSAKNMKYNSGLMQIDLDFKYLGGNDKAQNLLHALRSDKHIIIGGLSPSGYGVKLLIKTDLTDKISPHVYKEAQKQYAKHLEQLTGLELLTGLDKLPYTQLTCAFHKVKYSNGTITPIKANSNWTTFKVDRAIIEEPKKEIIIYKPLADNANVGKENNILNAAYDFAIKKHGNNFNTLHIQSITGFANKYGVEAYTIIEYLQSNEETAALMSEGKQTSINDITARNKRNNRFNVEQWTTSKNKASAGEKQKPKQYSSTPYKQALQANYKLSKDQYISDIKQDLISDIKQSHHKVIEVIAPTGAGKSFFIANHLKEAFDQHIIFAVPTISIAQQMQSSYGISIKIGSTDTRQTVGTKTIVTTYQQATKLLAVSKPNQYILVVDESHNFTAAAGPSFMNKTLSMLMDNFANAAKVLLFTGSPLDQKTPTLLSEKRIVIAKEFKQKKYVKITNCKDVNASAIEAIKADISKGNKVVIVMNDKGERAEKYKAKLSKYKVLTINASTGKDEEIQTFLNGTTAQQSSISYDILLATTYIETGVSLWSDSKANISFHILCSISESSIYQFASRYRKAKTVTTHLYNDIAKAEAYNFDSNAEYNSIYTKALSILDAIKKLKKGVNAQTDFAALIDANKLRTNTNTAKHTINYLLLDNAIHNKHITAISKDKNYLQHLLCEKYGFNVLAAAHSDSRTSKADIKKSKIVKAEFKKQKQDHLKKVFKDLRSSSIYELERKAQDLQVTNVMDQLTHDTYTHVHKVYKLLNAKLDTNLVKHKYKAVLDALEPLSNNANKIKQLKNVIYVQKLLSEKDHQKEGYNFYKMLLDVLKSGTLLKYNKAYTKQELLTAFTKMISKNSLVKAHLNVNALTAERCILMLKCLCVVNSKQVRKQVDKVRKKQTTYTLSAGHSLNVYADDLHVLV